MVQNPGTACGRPGPASVAPGPARAGPGLTGVIPVPHRARPLRSARVLGGPARGFGRMWEKTYTMTLEGVSPAVAIAPWQRSFPWPASHRPGKGVTMLYAGPESVTVSTRPAESLAGWITVSAERAGALTDVRVHVLMRARDPLSELAFALGGYRRQDRFWVAALTALAGHLARPDPAVAIRGVCLDSRHQWRNTANICHSPVLRGVARTVSVPVLALGLSALSSRTRHRA